MKICGLSSDEWDEWRILLDLQKYFKYIPLRKIVEGFPTFSSFEEDFTERLNYLHQKGMENSE